MIRIRRPQCRREDGRASAHELASNLGQLELEAEQKTLLAAVAAQVEAEVASHDRLRVPFLTFRRLSA